MNVTHRTRRLERLFYLLISAMVLVALPARAVDPAKTVVQDTLYRADGSAAKGTILISWPAFSTADGKPVAAGTLSAKIGANGNVNIPLLPTQGATPSGTAYKIVISLDDGSSSTEYWAVPSLSPTTIAAIRSSQVPATVAMQVVSREYVDQQLATAVRKNGDETIAGAKTFSTSPVVPTPGTDAAAANRGYVDTAIAAAAPSASNVLNVNKGGTGTNVFTPSRCVRVANDGNSLESSATDCGGANADTLDGQHASAFLGSTGQAADSDTVDGRHASDFLTIAAQASDSDRIDGLHATDLTLANQLGGKAVDVPNTPGQQLTYDGTRFARQSKTVVDVRDYPGVSIVEQTRAAVAATASSAGGTVLLPPGAFTTSSPSTWAAHSFGGIRCGVQVPDNVRISGSAGGTVLNTTWNASDPDAALFCNADPTNGNANLRIDSLTVNVTNNRSTYGPWTSVFFCISCSDISVDHIVYRGDANTAVRLVDSVRFAVEDNTFLLNSTATGKGDSAIAIARFSGTVAEPRLSFDNAGGSVRNNRVYQVGAFNTFSMIVVAQSNVRVEDNQLNGLDYTTSGNPAFGNSIEIGLDNLAFIPTGLLVSGNKIRGTAGISPVFCSDCSISNNDIYKSGISIQTADSSKKLSSSDVKVRNNKIKFGCIAVGDRGVGITNVLIEGNVVVDAGESVGCGITGGIYAASSGGNPNLKIRNNVVRGGVAGGIFAYGASEVVGNHMYDNGQARNNEPAIKIMPPNDGTTAKTLDVSFNFVGDTQAAYSTGTICSVADGGSTTCLVSGTSRFVYLSGGTWDKNWGNRRLWYGGTYALIRGILDTTHMELETAPAFIPAGTAFNLYRTTGTAFFLGNDVGSFIGNRQPGPLGPGANLSIVDVTGKTVDFIAGNYFNLAYYIQGGSGAKNYDYRLNSHTSTTVESNLNADLLDGKHAADFPAAGGCTNQVVTALNSGAAPSCGSVTAAMLAASSYRSAIRGYCTGAAGTTQVISVAGLGATAIGCSQSTAPGTAGALMTSGGTVKALYINEGTSQKSGTTMAWTVYKNNAATALTCTVASGATTCSDVTHSFTVASGDYLTVKSGTTASSSETLANVSVAMELWN